MYVSVSVCVCAFQKGATAGKICLLKKRFYGISCLNCCNAFKHNEEAAEKSASVERKEKKKKKKP